MALKSDLDIRTDNPASALDGSEIVIVTQGGVTKGALVSDLRPYVLAEMYGGVVAQPGTPLWTGLHSYVATAGGIRMSGSPALSENWLGLLQNFGSVYDLTAAKADKPEGTAHFAMTSGVGSANLDTAYKTALSATMNANSGSANGWAASFVASIGAGGTKRGGICLELDLNNLWGNYTGAPSSPYASNLHITGLNSGGYASTAISIEFAANASPMWNYGIYLGPTGFSPFNSVAVAVVCNGNIGYQLAGNWAIGLDLSSGVYSSYSIYAPGFAVDPTGKVGIGTPPTIQSKVHAYVSSASLQIMARFENDDPVGPIAAIGFQTSFSGTETRAAKAGIGLKRTNTQGCGELTLYNRITTDTADFTASDIVAKWDNANALQLKIAGVLKTITVDGSGFVKAA